MIRRLGVDSVKSLAAAQVILDLASATKELLENALDAGATQIMINFEEYGLDSVEVVDDGAGITLEDMEVLGERHCTSKIRTEDEVFRVKTFGFRGEALHSLSIISEDVIITSKAQVDDSEVGLSISLKNKTTPTKVACPKGTSVKVRGLLSTLPVRRVEWQRNVKRYFSKALWLLQSYVLAMPKVRFRCVGSSGGKTSLYFASNGAGDVSKAYAEAFKGELKGVLQHITIDEGIFSCNLHFSRDCRKSVDRQFAFLNDRPCDLPKVLKKLNEIYRSHTEQTSLYPIFVLYIKTSSLFDANLTPDKRQVILPFEEQLIERITCVFNETLSRHSDTMTMKQLPLSLLSSGDSQMSEATEIPYVTRIAEAIGMPSGVGTFNVPGIPNGTGALNVTGIPNGTGALNVTGIARIPEIPYVTGTPNASIPSARSLALTNDQTIMAPSLDLPRMHSFIDMPLDRGFQTTQTVSQQYNLAKDDFNAMEVIGQFNKGFILVKLEKNPGDVYVFIVDQHASDERFRLEFLQTDLSFTCQRMLIPVVLKIGIQDILFIQDHLVELERIGFKFSPLIEGSSLSLIAAPCIGDLQLTESDLSELIHKMRDEEFVGLYCLERVAEKLAYRACRSAVMIGDALNPQQMTQIVRNLASLKSPWICAHGRPTVRLLYTTRVIQRQSSLFDCEQQQSSQLSRGQRQSLL